MWLLLSAVITASLMGSLHCVGMCGPLAIWAAGVDRNNRSSSIWLATALYHGGRGLTYSLAGVIAGGVGQLLDWSGSTIGIQLLAARLVGGLMITFGAISLFRILRPKLNQWWLPLNPSSKRASGSTVDVTNPQPSSAYTPPQPNWITGQLVRFRPMIFKLPVAVRGLVVGLLTALLPCGWLYLFALLAAGTGSIQLGALVMVAFWLGSIPLLVGLVVGTRLFHGRARQWLPLAASLLLVVAGVYTASGRGFANLSSQLTVSSVLLDQLKEGVHADALDPNTVKAGLDQLIATPLPCCQERASAVKVSSPVGEHTLEEGSFP